MIARCFLAPKTCIKVTRPAGYGSDFPSLTSRFDIKNRHAIGGQHGKRSQKTSNKRCSKPAHRFCPILRSPAQQPEAIARPEALTASRGWGDLGELITSDGPPERGEFGLRLSRPVNCKQVAEFPARVPYIRAPRARVLNSQSRRGAERIFGYAADEMIGRPILTVIPPDRYDEEAKIIERIRRGERVDHYESARRRKNGNLVDISLTVSPVKDATGKVIGASKIARDITERKQAQARHPHRSRSAGMSHCIP